MQLKPALRSLVDSGEEELLCSISQTRNDQEKAKHVLNLVAENTLWLRLRQVRASSCSGSAGGLQTSCI